VGDEKKGREGWLGRAEVVRASVNGGAGFKFLASGENINFVHAKDN
jgi:hypothetical protein